MKNVENQLRVLRNNFSDKFPITFRNKIDKYILVLQQLAKNPSFRHLFNDIQNQDEQRNQMMVIQPMKQEVRQLRRQAEAYFKLEMTDYEAFLWKSNKQQSNAQTPQKLNTELFSLLKIRKPQMDTLASQDLEGLKNNFDYPILETKNKNLVHLATELIYSSGSFCQSNFEKSVILSLLSGICCGYNIVSYHHFSHAFSVFAMLFQCHHACDGFQGLFSESSMFFCYVAALCHDMGHRGVNEAYEIKKRSELALLYNHQSVLENMHISQFYRLLRENPDFDVVSKLKSAAQREQAKRLINRLILSTDCQLHTANIRKLQKIKASNHPYSSQQKQIILDNLFHACDLGNPCLEFQNYMNWAVLITNEFDEQAKLERKQGLEVSPNFEYIDIQTHFKRQIGFIDFLVYPLWKQLTLVIPTLSILKARIEDNRKKLKDLINV